jgi:L-ornithine Nalpha-acyltransferase
VTVSFQSGSFLIRLAESDLEIEMAQKLRYRVFHNEMGARGDALNTQTQKDQDIYDTICDHLLVFDLSREEGDQVIGNYRLIRHEAANKVGGFYTSQEFDLSVLLHRAETEGLHLMELGRSCVHEDYRTNTTIQLLWKGITAYIILHKVDVLFGCASFQEINVDSISESLSYLKTYHSPPEEWYVKPVADRAIPMNRLPENYSNQKQLLFGLPPLIKGYLRLGAWIGDGAVKDEDFGSIDVCIILPSKNIPSRYYAFFDRP